MDESADQWHSIRPWIHRFALSVNQVSSVSAAFTLKSALDEKPLDPALESLAEDEADDSGCASADRTDASARSRAVSDALAQGLSVKVNSSPWQRVIFRVDEESDEAIIIVFGLMPGRQYDIELGIAHPQEAIRSQITTNDSSPDQTVSHSSSNERDKNGTNGSADIVVSTSDASPSNIPNPLATPPDSAASPSSPASSTSNSEELPSSVSTPSITLEEKIQQLNQTLSHLQSERDTLTTTLKTTRRDTQRADAAIRADIETLKRASDRFASVEHRARQKVLALQETVKQTLAAAEDINASVTEVETSLPTLREQQVEAEKECKVTKQQAARAREEREALERQEKKRVDGLQTELAGLGTRLEKLNGKREKLETSIIPELEEELRRIEEAIAAASEPLLPVADTLDLPYPDPSLIGLSSQPGSLSALPGMGRFPDDVHSTSWDTPSGPTDNSRRRKYLSHPPLISKSQPPQMQKPIQILRPPHQPHQVRPPLTSNKSITSSSISTSTLSSLAAPFEPSPQRQAQLQNTLGASLNSNNIAPALKTELNPTSNVFAPRMSFTTSSTSATSTSTSTSHKSTTVATNTSISGRSAWSRQSQKSRRSHVE